MLIRLFLAVLLICAGGYARAGMLPAPDTVTLENGLQVVVIEDHRAPVVTHMIWYRVGAADEPPGKSGIAHFLEHLMFKGTDKIPEGGFSKVIAKNGGQDNAFTSHDYTAYFQRVVRDHLPLVMEMEADRMVNLRLTDELVLPERDVVLEERGSRTDNEPSALLREQVAAARYRNHPYGIPVIGWRHEIEQLSLRDALDFYNRFYRPNNAILIVAGDVTMDEVRPLAVKLFGPLERGAPIMRSRPQEPPQNAARVVTLSDPRVTSPTLSRVYAAPSYSTDEPGTAEALDVLSGIIGGGATGRLYRSLVIDGKIANGAGAYYSGEGLDSGGFSVYAVPANGQTLEAVETALDEQLDRILSDGVTEEELARAKRSLIAAAIYALDSQQSMARIYGSALTTGQTIADVVGWPDAIRAVTAEDVLAAAKSVFIPEASVTAYLRPKPAS